MSSLGAAFGAALVVTLGFALAARGRWIAIGAWTCLAAGWGVTVLIAPFGDRYVWVWPFMDAAFGTIGMAMAYRFRLIWPAILALLFLGQCVVHIAFHFMTVYGVEDDPWRVIRYYRAINLLLIAQMLCVAWPGGSRVVAVLVDRVRSIPRDHRRQTVARR